MKTITINVDESCIRHGKKGKGEQCAVALAVNKLLKKNYWSNIAIDISIYAKEELFKVASCRTPKEACRFIQEFDSDFNVTPISFTITLPEEVLCETKFY